MNSQRTHLTSNYFSKAYIYLFPALLLLSVPNPLKVSPDFTAERSSQLQHLLHGHPEVCGARAELTAPARLSWLKPGMQLICQQRSHPWIMESDCSNGTCYKTPIDFMGAVRQKSLCTYTEEVIWDSKLISAVLASGVLEVILRSYSLHGFVPY